MTDLSGVSREELLAALAETDPVADENDTAVEEVEESASIEDRVTALEEKVAILAPVIEYHKDR